MMATELIDIFHRCLHPCDTYLPISTRQSFVINHKTLNCVCNPDSDVNPRMHSRLHNQFPVNSIAWHSAFKELKFDDAVRCIPAMHVQANTSSSHLQESPVPSPACPRCLYVPDAFMTNVNIAQRHHAHAACSRCLCDDVNICYILYSATPLCSCCSVLRGCQEVEQAALADVIAVRERDPACTAYSSALLYYKGYHALQTHRIAHGLWQRGQKVLARSLQVTGWLPLLPIHYIQR